MADFEHKPIIGYTISRRPKRTLVSTYEDGNEDRRVKAGAAQLRNFRGTIRTTESETRTLLAQATTKGIASTLTILTYDPEAADPDTDTATCVYDSPPSTRYIGPDLYDTEVSFREVAS